MNSSSVLSYLQQGPIEDFFLYPMRDEVLEEAWALDKGGELEALLDDAAQPLKVRFLACEVLFKMDIAFQPRHDRKMMAQIYADALQEDLIGFSNPWGLLYDLGDEGTAGTTFLVLRENAIPALLELLKDERLRVNYIGSEEATLGNMRNYRLKDFAAWYISRIRNVKMAYFDAFADRDAEIQRMLVAADLVEE